jgi:hypothetical protein
VKSNDVLRPILATMLAVLLGLSFAGAGLAAEGQATKPRTCGFLRALLFSCPSSAPAPAPAPPALAPVVTPSPAAPPAVVLPAPSSTQTAPIKPAPAPIAPIPTPVSPPTSAPAPAPVVTPPPAAPPAVVVPAPSSTQTAPAKPGPPPIPTPTTTPTPLPTPITPPSTPIPSPVATHPTITATLLGQTGEDVVGTMSATPDGVKDVHIKLNGVSGTIKGVRITGLDGIWETPANGKNWLVAIRPQSNPSVVDLYIDFCNFCKPATSYTIVVTFSDGATQTIQAVSTAPTSSPAITQPPVAPSTPTVPTSPAPASTPTPVVSAQPGTSGTASIVNLASDPYGAGTGFARAHWTGSKMLVFFGHSHNPFAENSIRAFDPAANTWEYLWPNSNGADGLQNRDNFSSLYIPRLDELWVWGGSGLEAWEQRGLGLAWRSGRFSISQKKWMTMSPDDGSAFSAVVQNFGGGLIDSAMAWSDVLDGGLIFGGSDGGNASDRYWIIEPNPAGAQRYKMSEVLGGVRPPPRAQATNLMVAVGSDFYLLGGFAGHDPNNGNWTYINDLWKFSSATRTWTRLPDPPNVNYTPTLTYDADRNALVAWVNDKLYVYSITSRQWADMSPASLPCIFNQIGVYATTAKVHLFESGNKCPSGDTMGPVVYGVALGTVQPAPVSTPSPSTPISTPPPATPAQTSTAAPATPSTNPSPSAPVSGWLNIPLRTWVSRPLPPYQLDVRKEFVGQKGYGPGGGGELSGAGGASKHQRLVYNPDNKRVYFYSGDFTGPPFTSSFHVDMFSYDITRSSSSDVADYQNWTVEWPYCGVPGQISPANTDEAPFTWDSKRHLFWVTGGWEGGGNDPLGMCANGAMFYNNSTGNPTTHGPDILQFDPAQNRYLRPDPKYKLPAGAVDQYGRPLLGSSQSPRHSTYNPVTDEIIMIGTGMCGLTVIRMNASTGVWTQDCDAKGNNLNGGDAIDGGYLNDAHAVHEQLALDVEHQWIYWIDTNYKQGPDPNKRFRLMRYDITNHNMASMGWITLPWNTGQPNFCTTASGTGCNTFPFYNAPYDSTMLVYDSINKVVLWPASSNEGRPILMIYHPDPTGGKNGTWEVDPMNRDKPNEIIFGSNGTFIPELNVMIIYGGFGTPHSDYFASVCPSCNAPENYFWLYRYGNGK